MFQCIMSELQIVEKLGALFFELCQFLFEVWRQDFAGLLVILHTYKRKAHTHTHTRTSNSMLVHVFRSVRLVLLILCLLQDRTNTSSPR
jgi:hypothetical protein